MIRKSTFREIRQSMGRYLAILFIVMLGVAFFCGLKIYKSCMLETGVDYLDETNFFDYELISTLGYDDDAVEEIAESDVIESAEGSISQDVIMEDESGDTMVVRAHSITETINTLVLVDGNMPSSDDECVVDSQSEYADMIGEYITVSEFNDDDTIDTFEYTTYKIVGVVITPLYLNNERPSSDLGDGTCEAFIYLTRNAFSLEVYTEMYVTLNDDSVFFTDEYEDSLDYYEDAVTEIAEDAANSYYDRLLEDFEDEYGYYAALTGQDIEDLAEENGLTEAKTYVLTCETNAGYSTFVSNADIVDNISKIFPVFFFLVAALVCMTTMTRMIDEQRTQIGILKALGYSSASVLSKYLFYSGSAAFIGAVVGFFGGCWLFPFVIWKAYSMMYNFSDDIAYVINVPLGVASIVVALVCAMGATWVSCMAEFRCEPAELIRPKAPKSGKRVLIERIGFIWNRIGFLYKVSIRNIFRYKKRFFLMILGISGCTALLVAGFGLNTTVTDVAGYQYSEIFNYDYYVVFDEDMDEDAIDDFEDYADGRYKSVMYLSAESVDITANGDTSSVSLITADAEGFDEYVDLHYGDEAVDYPSAGEAVVCKRLETVSDIEIGDVITISNGSDEFDVTVSGICDNYVYNYVYISYETYEEGFGDAAENKLAFVIADLDGVDDEDVDTQIRIDAAYLGDYDGAVSTFVNVDMQDRIESMMSSLGAVVLLVILSAGLLAFVVLYNLTNINILERIREIATIKVLGFYPSETAAYVFRENFFLTAIGALLGLPLGKWLLTFVINSVTVDMIYFYVKITWTDYLWAVLLTFAFTLIVNLVMYPKLKNVNMTESLKFTE